jgi:hypothetical protein
MIVSHHFLTNGNNLMACIPRITIVGSPRTTAGLFGCKTVESSSSVTCIQWVRPVSQRGRRRASGFSSRS